MQGMRKLKMWLSMIVRLLKILMTLLLALLFLISVIPLFIVDMIRYIIWNIDDKDWCSNFFLIVIAKIYED